MLFRYFRSSKAAVAFWSHRSKCRGLKQNWVATSGDFWASEPRLLRLKHDFWAIKKICKKRAPDKTRPGPLPSNQPEGPVACQTLPIPNGFPKHQGGHPNGSPALSHTTALKILVSLSGVPLRIEKIHIYIYIYTYIYIIVYTIFAHVPLLMNRYHSTLGTLGCRCTKPIALCRQEPS